MRKIIVESFFLCSLIIRKNSLAQLLSDEFTIAVWIVSLLMAVSDSTSFTSFVHTDTLSVESISRIEDKNDCAVPLESGTCMSIALSKIRLTGVLNGWFLQWKACCEEY